MTVRNERDQCLILFAERLVLSLKQKVDLSPRKKSAAKAGDLSRAIGCSDQMARRYVLGKALPPYNTILEISTWLNVNPGWLLFGELKRACGSDKENLLGIDYEITGRILLKYFSLFKCVDNPKSVVKFLLDVIYDASHLKADRETIIKMVDVALASATGFAPFGKGSPVATEQEGH